MSAVCLPHHLYKHQGLCFTRWYFLCWLSISFSGNMYFIEVGNTYSLELYCFAMGSRGSEAKVTPKQNCARSCGRLRHIYHRPERGFTFLVSNSSLSLETNFLKHGIVGESNRLIFSNLFVFVIQAKKVAGGLTDSWDFHFHKNIEQ